MRKISLHLIAAFVLPASLVISLPAGAESLSGFLLNEVNPETRTASAGEVERLTDASGWKLTTAQIDQLSSLSATKAGSILMQALAGGDVSTGEVVAAALDVFGQIPSGLLGGEIGGIVPMSLIDGACSLDGNGEIAFDFSSATRGIGGVYEVPGEVIVTCPEDTVFRLMTSQMVPGRPIGLASNALYRAGYDVWIGDLMRERARITLMSNGLPISDREMIAENGPTRVEFIARLHDAGDMAAAPKGQGAVSGLTGFERLVVLAY